MKTFFIRRQQRLENKRRKKKRQFWVWDIFLQRDDFRIFNISHQKLKYNREYYYRYLRMSTERFSHLLSLVQERVSKKDFEEKFRFQKSIFTEERLILLILTLRFLASGENQQSLSFSFRIGRQSVSRQQQKHTDVKLFTRCLLLVSFLLIARQFLLIARYILLVARYFLFTV